MVVSMKNPKIGEIKEVKVGFSWILFLFSVFFGLPLFLRKLYIWGGVFLALWVVHIMLGIIGQESETAAIFYVLLQFIFIGLMIFMGIKGNELTAKNYLEQGWEFVDNDSEVVQQAKRKWNIHI